MALPLPTSASLNLKGGSTESRVGDTSGSSRSRFDSGAGLRSSIVTNFAMGEGRLNANTGDTPPIPTWAYVAGAAAVLGIGFFLLRRRRA